MILMVIKLTTFRNKVHPFSVHDSGRELEVGNWELRLCVLHILNRE